MFTLLSQCIVLCCCKYVSKEWSTLVIAYRDGPCCLSVCVCGWQTQTWLAVEFLVEFRTIPVDALWIVCIGLCFRVCRADCCSVAVSELAADADADTSNLDFMSLPSHIRLVPMSGHCLIEMCFDWCKSSGNIECTVCLTHWLLAHLLLRHGTELYNNLSTYIYTYTNVSMYTSLTRCVCLSHVYAVHKQLNRLRSGSGWRL